MKKFITIILTLTLLCTPLTVLAGNGDTIVHITKTGEKYHSDGCSYLKSDIPISLADAVGRGYTPCSRCNPPILTADTAEPDPQPTVTAEQNDASYNEPVSAKPVEEPAAEEAASVPQPSVSQPDTEETDAQDTATHITSVSYDFLETLLKQLKEL